MKTLANCKPSEFVAQTYKIKKAVWNWLDITKVLEIRKTAPEGLVKISEDMTMEQKGEALTKNKELIFAQANFCPMFLAFSKSTELAFRELKPNRRAKSVRSCFFIV